MAQAGRSNSTTEPAVQSRADTVELLSRFFPRWLGDAPEPAVTLPPAPKPAPAAQALVLA